MTRTRRSVGQVPAVGLGYVGTEMVLDSMEGCFKHPFMIQECSRVAWETTLHLYLYMDTCLPPRIPAPTSHPFPTLSPPEVSGSGRMALPFEVHRGTVLLFDAPHQAHAPGRHGLGGRRTLEPNGPSDGRWGGSPPGQVGCQAKRHGVGDVE